jgi:prepilin-type processing-associated H-X9-DG protein
MLAILPELEQSQLYNSLNLNLAAWEPENATVVRQRIEVYTCPSQPDPGDLFRINYLNGPIAMTYSSYVGNLGSNFILDYYDYGPQQQPDGVLFRQSSVRTAQIEDGTSHTLAAGERVHPDRLLHPVWSFGVTGKVVGDSSEKIKPPDAPGASWGFSSFHTGGAQFLMADGSVGLLTSEIDYDLFRGLSTRAGHEAVERPF